MKCKEIHWITLQISRIWLWHRVNSLRKVAVFESLSASDPFRILFVYPIKTGRVGTGFLPAVLQNTVENVVSRYDKINSHLAITSMSGNQFFCADRRANGKQLFQSLRLQNVVWKIDFHRRLQTRGNCSVNHTNWKSLQWTTWWSFDAVIKRFNSLWDIKKIAINTPWPYTTKLEH